MQSKLFNSILTVAQFIPIPIVQAVVGVINMAKAAYMTAQGIKHGSIGMVLGGVAGVAAGVASAVAALGPVDILVNNAGVPAGMMPVQFREMDPSEWQRFIDLNLYGVLACTRAVIDGMCERGFGRVITISSGAGQVGIPFGVSIYGAGKGGAIAFMRHLALEVARSGVTANSLALGLMDNVGGEDVVFVELTEGTYEVRPVVLGVFDGVVHEVIEGVAVGDRIATGGVFLLKSTLLGGEGEGD